MRLLLVGLSHRTASVELRERLSVKPEEAAPFLRALLARPQLREGALISTCNRVEVYAAAEEGCAEEEALASMEASLLRSVSPAEARAHLYRLRDAEAVRHLFRVAAGLDSMVVGETEVLGQVKEAYLLAVQAQAAGGTLNPLFQGAFRAAKEVHTETRLSQGRVSVGSVAVDLASRIFQDLSGRKVLVIGAGEMARVVLEHLSQRGARQIVVVNRRPEAGQEVARAVGGSWLPFDRLEEPLRGCDIVISSTAAPGIVLTREMVARAVSARRHRPIFLIDIAVPRDVDPAAGDLEDVFLYDIDDLEAIVSENLRRRAAEVDRSEAIVRRHAEAYAGRFLAQDWERLLGELQRRFEAVGLAEMEDLWRRAPGLPPERRAEVEASVRRLLDRISSLPADAIRRHVEEGDGKELVAALRTLYRL